MADFDKAFEFMLPHEGGYSDDPDDRGRQTKFGISHKAYPDVDIESLTLGEAKDIYRRDYWDSQHYERFASQSVANKVFDLSVNMGFHQAHKILQRACCDNAHPVVCDGHIGPLTIAAANESNPSTLVEAICKHAEAFYRQLVESKPSNAKFLGGWISRANA